MKKIIFLMGILIPAIYVTAETNWWDRFLKKAEPQVLQKNVQPKPDLKVGQEVISLQDSFARVAESVKPAVVNIAAVQITRVQDNPHEFYFGDPNDFFYRFFGEQQPQRRKQPREQRVEGTGSGVIIDPDGYILTNNHVVQDADQLTVTLSDERKIKGRVVGTDSRTDLAVIKIKDSNPLPFAPLGDSSEIRVGDFVLAIGSPFGLEQTVTSGIISAIRQSLNIEGRNFQNLIQTDAAINRGNSGGPMVNLRGQVIGINTAIYAPTGVFSGIGFAIPVNKVKSILDDLIKKGYVERSWMGVEIAEINDVIAESFGLDSTEGALINNVIAASPAEKAGLQRGDVIIKFDGQRIKNVISLQDIVSQTPPGRSVQVNIIRNGKSKAVTLVTDVMPTPGGVESSKKRESGLVKPTTREWMGATFGNLTDRLREQYSIPNAQGVLVLEVPPGSMAAEAGLVTGDLVQSVNQRRTSTVSDLASVSDKVDLKKGVVFDVLRQGKNFYLSFKSLQ